MINSVSFRSTTATSFQEKLAKPQAYTKADTPVAASGLDAKKEKNGSTGKKIAGVVILAGALAAGLALGKGKISVLKDKVNNETLKKCLEGLETAGTVIAEKAGQIKELVLTKLPKTKVSA